MLSQQSRLAQMGESINMIAHQWRQPLNNINGSVVLMDLKISKQENINNDLLEKEFDEIETTTAYMSHTIDDFRDFFKPTKEKVNFNLEETIANAIRLLKPMVAHDEINIHHQCKENIKLFGYPNEIGQVMINIINNAKDALLSNNINKEKNISIFLRKENKKVVICIQDNAGGINLDIIKHIFDPYFSTKLKKDGTGLGLYISKMIVEEHMSGKLSVKNSDEGALFRIEF
jgi:signal transduction histidine kinase